MHLFRVAVAAAFVSAISACSSSDPVATDGGTNDGGDPDTSAPVGSTCASTTNVSDGPTVDATIAAGATTLVCYYPQPSEGYCRKITNSASIGNYISSKDKGAIGCKDAVILAGPECPTKNAVGKCDASSIDAQRVYYKCSKFTDPKAHCAQITGTFTAL